MLTILTCRAPLVLAKTWLPDGSIKAYDGPKYFTHESRPVDDLAGLHAALVELGPRSDSCVIRGQLRDQPTLDDAHKDGFVMRRKTYFDDVPRSWVMFDIDGWEGVEDWVADPPAAFAAWVKAILPPEFHRSSFVWQLSGSAGRKPGLRGHVWFWLMKPMLSTDLRAWATVYKVETDRSVLDSVQVHYTADPIMDGVADPLWERVGLRRGEFPSVGLVYDPARLQEVVERANVSKLRDPREKPGVVGAFCRAFSPADVLNAEWFTGRFTQARGERWTWLDGGGTPEGVRVTENHLINVHNTAPQDSIAKAVNAFDVMRLYMFSQLDDGEYDWAYANQPSARPSYRAAKEFALTLPGVSEDAALPEARTEAESAALTRYQALVAAAETYDALVGPLATEIKADAVLTDLDRSVLVRAYQVRIQRFTGASAPVGEVRRLLAPGRVAHAGNGPDWLAPWVYMSGADKFVHRGNKRALGRQGFDGEFNRRLNSPDGSASRMACDLWDIPTVQDYCYLPTAGELFDLDGVPMLNLYRHDRVPRGYWDDRVSGVIDRHLQLLTPNSSDRKLLSQWMAWVVRNPGRKVRYALLLKGLPGDGKTVLAKLMRAAMGHDNVKEISPTVIQESSFTAWAEGACVGVIEEIRLPAHRFDVLNKVKPYITNDAIDIHRKGQDPIQVPNTMNYLALTNFGDALPLDDLDRRWLVLSSPWRDISEMEALIDEDYWDELHGLEQYGSAVRAWFESVDLSDFNPNGRAPATGFRSKMIRAAAAPDAHDVREIIESGSAGVSSEILSVSHLSAAMLDLMDEVPRGKALGYILRGLGFEQTPVQRYNGQRYRAWAKPGVDVPTAFKGLMEGVDSWIV